MVKNMKNLYCFQMIWGVSHAMIGEAPSVVSKFDNYGPFRQFAPVLVVALNNTSGGLLQCWEVGQPSWF
jgi:hypothetical protein